MCGFASRWALKRDMMLRVGVGQRGSGRASRGHLWDVSFTIINQSRLAFDYVLLIKASCSMPISSSVQYGKARWPEVGMIHQYPRSSQSKHPKPWFSK